MTNDYYLHRGGENHGPYPKEHLVGLIASGEVAQEELVCEQGTENWIAASTLMGGVVPGNSSPALNLGSQSSQSVNRGLAVTEEQVRTAYQKLKIPILGIVFSLALPAIIWSANSDAERGVRGSAKNRVVREVAQKNSGFLPIAIVIGLVGVAGCSIWLSSSAGKAKKLKKQFNKQRMG